MLQRRLRSACGRSPKTSLLDTLPLRILIIAHGHPKHSAGGAELAAYLLFRALRRMAGIEAHFLSWGLIGPGRRAIERLEGVSGHPDETILYTSKFDSFLLSQPSRSAIEQFILLLNRIDPDVVHFHHYTNFGVEFISAARRYKPSVRLIITLHEYLAICHNYGTMVKTPGFALCDAAGDAACAACFPGISPGDFARRRRYILSHFAEIDLFIAPSEFLRRRYTEWGIPAAKFIAIENGIEPVRPPPPRPCAPGEGRAVFGFFGQIHPFKGLLELLSAFDHLTGFSSKATRAIRLVIHGAHLELNQSEYVAAFRGLLARHEGQVHFAGPYARRDQHRLMAAVDWVVVPSIWWENSPLVIEEAFAHRRPVICSGIGGMAEKVRPGKDGFHFPVGDSVALARLLVRLAEDEATWQALQATIRPPKTIAESVARHLQAYRQ